jgi:hypothetical protein
MRPASHFGSFVAALAFVLILATAGAAVDLARAGTIPASDVARVATQAHVAAELVSSASQPNQVTRATGSCWTAAAGSRRAEQHRRQLERDQQHNDQQ